LTTVFYLELLDYSFRTYKYPPISANL